MWGRFLLREWKAGFLSRSCVPSSHAMGRQISTLRGKTPGKKQQSSELCSLLADGLGKAWLLWAGLSPLHIVCSHLVSIGTSVGPGGPTPQMLLSWV